MIEEEKKEELEKKVNLKEEIISIGKKVAENILHEIGEILKKIKI